MRKFVIPQHAIQTEASIDIGAPSERVAGIYRDVYKWDEFFR